MFNARRFLLAMLIKLISEVSDDTEIRACLSGVFLTDPKDDREALKHNKGSRVDGTCTWIKGHELYNSWLSSDSQLLWLSGGPGKGKTMISIYLAQDLEQSIKHSQNTILLQYFCDNKDERRNTATAILRGLIFQLLQARRHLFTHILPSYQIQKESLFSPSSFQTLWRIFETMLHDHALDRIYCVLDGLDECEENSLFIILDKFKELFKKNLQGSRTFHLNLIIASRDVPNVISQLLLGFPRIRLDPDSDLEVNRDINRFIEVKVTELSIFGQYPLQLSEHIKDVFRTRARGTFLWVGIVANNLRNCSKTEVIKYLDLFPTGLDEVYARILLQIERHRRENAAKILRWVAMSVRPLTLAELSVVIGTSDDPSIILFSHTEIAKDQISWCGSFLTITGDEVNLIHQSAKDYLLRKDIDSKPELEFFRVKEEIANLEIATKCFNYLQEGALADGPVRLKQETAHLTKFPLLSYAVVYWPVHARSLARSAEIFKISNSFYQKTSKIRHSWLQTWVKKGPWSSHPQPPSTLLHIVSYLGILPLAKNLLLEHFSSLEGKDGRGRTALHLAVEGGHDGVVRLLLEKGADIEAKDGLQCTALHSAAKNGRDVVVQLLLKSGANIEAKNDYGKTALHFAAKDGHDVVVQLLLKNEANIETKNKYGYTALHSAVKKGHDVVVQRLLKNGANIEAKGRRKRVALHYAIDGLYGGNEGIVRLLLDNGANASAADGRGRTPLVLAKGKLRKINKEGIDDEDTEEKRETMQAIIRLLSPDG